MKSIFLFLLPSLLLISSTLVENSIQQQIFTAYTTDNTKIWQQSVQKLADNYKQNQSKEALFELVKAQYGFIGHCSGTKQNELSKQQIPKAKKNLEQLLAQNEDWAEAHALMSSLYGLEISVSSSFKTMTLGRKSLKHISKAIALDESSPIVCVQYANSKFHAPKMFGGDTDVAIKYYQKALRLFEQQPNHQQNWMYLEALAATGLAYEAIEQYEKSAKTYDKALDIAPHFRWIKEDLYPKLKAKKG